MSTNFNERIDELALRVERQIKQNDAVLFEIESEKTKRNAEAARIEGGLPEIVTGPIK